MVYPKNFPGDAGIQIGIVASGGDPDSGDHPSDHSSNMKIVSPLEHGRNVDVDHIAFSPMMASPDGGTNRQFKGALPPGSLVYFLKTSGQSGGIILGQANDINNRGNRTPGNADLLGPWSYLSEIDTGVSGEVAEKMGKLLKEMGTTMQLMAITHLPQVASKGTHHLRVEKSIKQDTTVTNVRSLSDNEREMEIARLMSGEEITDAALVAARQLMNS